MIFFVFSGAGTLRVGILHGHVYDIYLWDGEVTGVGGTGSMFCLTTGG